ncbi:MULTISPECIES: MATE family efflux transporter [unclassified Bradyrhizobium]|uniref:MATE family efflux transporter n=1 Tax=unclassified Bradyrhizobium TaxID=2631580 RepID=UPI00209E615D|nr:MULTISPECIES: MATE family efflux transporter [unclassified Bradyrhizobium]MCP1838433.1 MATE family multidrug resistance protein [Bradyrhizobium sp. USDA 4538]MCP1898997.1 MATE family multidrug resistance protein [Bradyrhizobium sp. USDA 4537]MCP1986889.1 MATE family multidrug resistance protein [Bradyrhizobium sp. USDA 4539]
MDKITKSTRLSHTGNGLTKWPAAHDLVIELRETAKLALPMALTQVGQIVIMTIDLAFIGRIGPEALAAAALASRVYLVTFAVGVGLLAAIAPLVAQGFGAANLTVVRRSLRMGLWSAVLLSLPIIVLALRGEQILLALEQEPHTARLAQQYLFGLAWGAAPALWFYAIRTFMGAVNQPEPGLWITLAATPVNALLVYLLIYGKLGLPRLELFGAGLATSLVNWGTCLAGFWFVKMGRPLRDYHVLVCLWRFDWPSMRQLIVIGAPLSVGSLITYGLFSAVALLAGLISTSALAAHQIAAHVAMILFMISFAIGTAAAVRVGQAVGRNDRIHIRRAGLAAMLLGIMIALLLTLAVIVARFAIAQFFLGDSDGDAQATIRLATKLILIGATFFITDAAHSIAAGGLRGLKDTWVPLLFACIAYWPIGFSLSYALSAKMGLGVVGIWIGLSVGTTVHAGLLVLRFQLLANRRSSNEIAARTLRAPGS